MLSKLLRRDHEPVFLNEGASRAELELKKMEALRTCVADEDKERLEEDIRITRAGIKGEEKIRFELMNSHYPLVLIHDLCLELQGARAQIDFVVITPCNAFALECKNLVGNISIDSSGAFTREFGRGRYRKAEGIYSPVTQNERHVELMKAIVKANKGRFINAIQSTFLDDYYHSLVVLANERTVLRADNAPREVRDVVIRADQLVARIKEMDERYARKNSRESFSTVKQRGELWLSRNTPASSDLSERYQIVAPRPAPAPEPSHAPEPKRVATPEPMPDSNAASPTPETPTKAELDAPACPKCGAPMVLRTAARGERSGQQFWGCSMYGKTRCRGIINL